MSIYRALGKSPFVYEAEQLRGGVVKTLSWTGGDTELMLKASGEGIGKYVLGYSASVTLADGSGTTLTFANAEEAYRFGFGFYQIENEVIKITARPTSTTATIARAQISTTGAAHAGVPMRPYIPTLTYAGSPISEGGTVTCTVDGVTLRALSFGIDFTTGLDLLPGESGSRYVQGPKAIRYDLKAKVKLVLARESYNKIIREHGNGGALSPAFRDALDAANAEVTVISARIASVVITVHGATTPHVTIDGETVPPAGLGLKRPIDPGSHTVKADAPGFA